MRSRRGTSVTRRSRREVVSALAFAVLWFALLVLTTAVVVISLLNA
jgi:hypothetical protein